MRKREASLYFHVPFCLRKCPYCHFYVVPNKPSYHQLLMEGLNLEWKRQKPLLADHSICTVYFGGGTPALLGPEKIGEILSWLPVDHQAEITLEVNPEQATVELLREFRSVGVNRLSFGVQSFDDDLLTILGREHSAHEARRAIEFAHSAGFDNVTIDLMMEIPTQTTRSWQLSLDEVATLPITHLSLYNLTFEPHTSYYKNREELQRLVPEEQRCLAMLRMAVEQLPEMGLARYEISAFAKEGYASKHNLGYWQGRPFLGLGPSAFSYWEGSRFRNSARLHHYHRALVNGDSPIDYEEKLEGSEAESERLAIALRVLEGVEETRAMNHPAVAQLITQGLLVRKNERVALSDKGRLFYDSVAADLI